MTHGTTYAALLKLYQHAKDRHAALFSLHHQYAGHDKWELELTKQDNLLHNCIWRGQFNFSLEKFISQHHNAFVLMQQCAQHVSYQLLNEYACIGYILNGIETLDAFLRAAMAQISLMTLHPMDCVITLKELPPYYCPATLWPRSGTLGPNVIVLWRSAMLLQTLMPSLVLVQSPVLARLACTFTTIAKLNITNLQVKRQMSFTNGIL